MLVTDIKSWIEVAKDFDAKDSSFQVSLFRDWFDLVPSKLFVSRVKVLRKAGFNRMEILHKLLHELAAQVPELPAEYFRKPVWPQDWNKVCEFSDRNCFDLLVTGKLVGFQITEDGSQVFYNELGDRWRHCRVQE